MLVYVAQREEAIVIVRDTVDALHVLNFTASPPAGLHPVCCSP